MDMPSILDATAVRALPNGAGRYAASVTRDWDAPVYPSGGMVATLALRAMQTELAQPHQALRSFSTMFVSTVNSARSRVGVERLRVGKRMSQLRADVRSPGSDAPGHVTTAAFGEAREGFDFSYSAAPDVGEPDEYPGPAQPPPARPWFRSRFFDNLDVRRVRMFHSFETELGRRTRGSDPLDPVSSAAALADGRIDPLCWPGIADTMPPGVAQYVGPGYPFFHAPSVDLTMRFFADTDEEWCLVRVMSHWASDGYASAEATLWDGRRKLIAHATQLMLVRFPDPQDFLRS
jgi:acyl-CoA thioesterase